MPIHISAKKLSAEQRKEHGRIQATIRRDLGPTHFPKDDSSENRERQEEARKRYEAKREQLVESLEDAVLKLRLKQMSELIGERAGQEAGENFYALGLAHMKGKEAFRKEFDRRVAEQPPKSDGNE